VYWAIIHVCDRAQGDDWTSIAGLVARYGGWEFEDYRESAPLD